MTTTSPDRPVLVVGAGPTGLTLAAQLLGRGIPTRIVDRSEGPSPCSRALGVHARTLELLDTMGLADAFLAQGHRVRRLHMYSGGRTLLDLDLGHNGSAYGFVLHLPQQTTEHLLRARVRELGGTIEDGVELVRLSARDDGVDVTLRDRAGRGVECTAGYVVGCDGAHSRVRHELELAFEGQPYAQDWLLADVALEGAGADDEAHLFFRPNGLPVTCLPMGGDRWRVVLPNAGDRGGRPPSLAEIQELVAERAPWRLQLGAPEWLSCFRCQLRSTTSYRRGRVFLAGDAAHIHSPAAGQGMNTGMMDAANLAWKLALVADGRAPDRLLDTYGQERLPVAAQVIGFTDRFVGLMTMRRPVQRALRDALVPRLAGLPAVQRRTAGRVSQVSVGYPTSELTPSHHGGRGPVPGERVPDIEVRSAGEPTRLYEVLRGGRHVLLRWPAPDRQAAAPVGLDGFDGLLDVVHGRLDCTHGWGAIALVRPDGFLAVRGSAKDIDRVTAYLRQLSGTPLSPAAPVP
jgi:2-polyprenyl-6-methoxyphenol hydroxylase-like FAD-dependent oxidoreductase